MTCVPYTLQRPGGHRIENKPLCRPCSTSCSQAPSRHHVHAHAMAVLQQNLIFQTSKGTDHICLKNRSFQRFDINTDIREPSMI